MEKILPLPLEVVLEQFGKEELKKALGIGPDRTVEIICKERGLDGKPGKDGRDGKDGLNGKDGKDGRDGIDGVGIQGPKGDEGKPGKDGKDGLNGKDGKDGLNGKDGRDGKDGKDGLNGKDGKDGRDGIDGKDGLDGKSITLEDLTKEQTASLKKKIVGKVVSDLQVKDSQLESEISVKYSDGTTKKHTINKFVTARAVSRSNGLPSSESTLPEESILYLASLAPSVVTYTGDKITLLTYSDFLDITSHTKTLSYTGDLLTQTVETFVYASQTWTITIGLSYVNNIWSSKSINISKV